MDCVAGHGAECSTARSEMIRRSSFAWAKLCPQHTWSISDPLRVSICLLVWQGDAPPTTPCACGAPVGRADGPSPATCCARLSPTLGCRPALAALVPRVRAMRPDTLGAAHRAVALPGQKGPCPSDTSRAGRRPCIPIRGFRAPIPTAKDSAFGFRSAANWQVRRTCLRCGCRGRTAPGRGIGRRADFRAENGKAVHRGGLSLFLQAPLRRQPRGA